MHFLIIFVFTLIIPFIVLPKYIIEGRMSPYRAVMQSTLVISAMAVIVFMFAYMTGEGVMAQMQDMIKLTSEMIASDPQFVELMGTEYDTEAARVNMLVKMYNDIFQQMPVCIMFTGAIVSYIAYIILSKTLSKKHAVHKLPPFREFSFPGGTAIGIMLMYLISALFMGVEALSGDMLYANMNLLFDIVFSLQGISVVLMFCHMKRMPKAVGVIIALVLWMTVIGRMLLVVVGLFDLMMGIKAKITGGIPRK